MAVTLSRWKTDVYPAFHHDGPQDHIDKVLKPEQADILLGVFWKKLGSAGTDGKSGTEHEVRTALTAAREQGKPHIMLYFSQAPDSPPQSPEESDEMTQLLRFKREMQEDVLYAEYLPDNFKDQIRQHLLSHIFLEYAEPAIPEITAMATPELVRAESLTDRIEEVVLSFRNYAPGIYDIRLVLNIAVTNRLLSSNITDSSFLVDGQVAANGELLAPNVLLFRAIKIHSSTLIARIAGVRVDGTMFGVAHPPYGIVGSLAIQPTGLTNSPTAIDPPVLVGLVKSGLSFRVWGTDYRPLPMLFSRREGVNSGSISSADFGAAKMSLYFQFSEGLPNAFRTKKQEGHADFGTRFQVLFVCVPWRSQIWVTVRDIPALSAHGQLRAVLVPSEADSNSDLKEPESRQTAEGVPLGVTTQ
jgi:hypothetical protein